MSEMDSFNEDLYDVDDSDVPLSGNSSSCEEGEHDTGDSEDESSQSEGVHPSIEPYQYEPVYAPGESDTPPPPTQEDQNDQVDRLNDMSW